MASLVVYIWVSKRLKKFIYRSCLTALVLGMISYLYEQIGPALAGDYFTLILWAIRILTLGVVTFIGWRLWVGIQSGYLLFDDLDD